MTEKAAYYRNFFLSWLISTQAILFCSFHNQPLGFHCRLRALVKTVAYSLAKISECIDFVELNGMAFYSGQKPKSTLS